MKKGEKLIFAAIVVVIGGLMGRNFYTIMFATEKDPGIPFYTTADETLDRAGNEVYSRYQCKKCHTLWTMRDMMRNVPAPMIDGIGSLRSETWLYDYLSSEDPQSILPSRLKPQYRMPSYAHMEASDRRNLAAYLSSLRVEDWYLEELKKMEYRKLTGEDMAGDKEVQ